MRRIPQASARVPPFALSGAPTATSRWLFTEGVGIVAGPVVGSVSLSLSNGIVPMVWTNDAAGEGVANDWPVSPVQPEYAWTATNGTDLDWGAATTKLAMGMWINLPGPGVADWYLMTLNDNPGSSFGTDIFSAQWRSATSEVRVYTSAIPPGDNYYGFDLTGLLVGVGPIYVMVIYDSDNPDVDQRIRFAINGVYVPREGPFVGKDLALSTPLPSAGANGNIVYAAANEVAIFMGAADIWVGSIPSDALISRIASRYAVNHDLDPEGAAAAISAADIGPTTLLL